MSDTTSNTPNAAPAAPAKSGALKWIVILVVAVLVLGGGGAAAWWFMRGQQGSGDAGGEGAAAPAKAAVTARKPVGGAIVQMDQFLVNLADKDASRFLRLKLGLVVETKKDAEAIDKDDVAKARIRSAILETLAQQTADGLVTPEGKAALKKVIAERATAAAGSTKVLDVLFTDFVVQF